MNERCILIPALKKNAVIPDQLVKRLAGVTLIERALHTARAVVSGEHIIVLTDSQEISLICERSGVGCRYNPNFHFTSLDIVSEMRELLEELATLYEHCLILRASCPLLTWVDIEDAWKRYADAHAASLVTVKRVRQQLWNIQGDTLEHLLSDSGEQSIVLESRALIILRSEAFTRAVRLGQGSVVGKVIPYFLDDRAIEIQGYQDWWICERLLLRRHIVFVVAGFPAIGMGHVFRALMLAHEITDHNVTFVCTRESELAVESIARKEYRIIRQGGEDLATTVLRLRPDLVINDILNTDEGYMEALVAAQCKVVNFEDMGTGAERADLVINALYEDDHASSRYCCGPNYFCLRDEFASARQNVFRDTVRTVLVTFGGTDTADCTRRVLDCIEPLCRERGITIRIVAGPGYAHKERLEQHLAFLSSPLIEFTWATNVMSRMMEGADIAISAAGRTVYELAHMRIPALVIAQHEREALHTFARERNGFVFLGQASTLQESELQKAFLQLLDNEQRKQLFERQCQQDFTANKGHVVGMMLALLGV